ncbi:MAG: hypothetical protein HC763_02725 [Hydrococcus sp. CRU_1_1]|nr:hypothetical protein [Hydrococcus sp. CRU_1_1]NJQ97191.1 hypothetical protein [Hydrococcus sp. CSU_1_8]
MLKIDRFAKKIFISLSGWMIDAIAFTKNKKMLAYGGYITIYIRAHAMGRGPGALP